MSNGFRSFVPPSPLSAGAGSGDSSRSGLRNIQDVRELAQGCLLEAVSGRINFAGKSTPLIITEHNSMKHRTPAQLFVALITLCAGLAIVCPSGRAAEGPPPEVTKDGLHLYKQTKQRIAYVRPGATFTQYKQVLILDPYVEFSKEWVKDYNRDQRDPSRQIRDSDLERARKALQADFRRIFTEELQKGGRYQVTDSGGPDVLVLRPALINIQVSAPDLMTPGRSVTYVQSAGAMTIYLELWDSASNTILARVIDGKVDPDLYGQPANSVTNRAAADRMMRSWADELRNRLDLVRGKDVAP